MLKDIKIACFQILTRPDANPLNKPTLCKTNHTCSIHADNSLGDHVCTWAGRKENGRTEETTPLIVSSWYQHKGCQCAPVGWTVSSWCAAHAFLTSSQGVLLFHLLPGCTACWRIHYRQSSINYKFATATQKNILETDEIMKTEKLQREGAIYKRCYLKGVWFFFFVWFVFFFWRGKVTSEAGRRGVVKKHTERSCSRKTELSVRSSISGRLYSILFLQ